MKKFMIMGIIGLFLLGGISSCKSNTNNNETTTIFAENKNQDKLNIEDNKIKDYEVTLNKAKIGEDYKGDKTLIVNYTMTNNSDGVVTFDGIMNDSGKFGDTILELATIKSEYNKFANYPIKPGESVTLERGYELPETFTNGKIELILTEWFAAPPFDIITFEIEI